MVELTRAGLLRAAACTAVACTVLAGCTSTTDGTPTPTGGSTTVTGNPTDPEQVLQARPDLDTALSQYRALLKAIRDQLATEHLTSGWDMFAEPAEARCTEFGDVGARLDALTRTTGDWSAASITDVDWPRALAIVKKAGGTAGFTTTEVVKDQPGDHDVFIQGPYGAVLEFGTKIKTILGVRSGCHRVSAERAEPTERAEPAAPSKT